MKGPLWAWALGTLLVAGCITKDSGRTDAGDVWRQGVTTRRDVVACWGNPDRIAGNTWIWKGSRLVGGRVRAAYMLVGVTVSNSEISTCDVCLTFDRKGLLVSAEAGESVSGGPRWSLIPW